MGSNISFGTDGWRAIIAEDFTFDNVRACARGVGDYINSRNLAQKGLVIGYDTRFASEHFAAAAAEVIAACGIKVYFCTEAAPTPTISYIVTATGAAGGIIITASHNPGDWNGFKYKDETGASAPTELVSIVERNTNEALKKGDIRRIPFEQAQTAGMVIPYEPKPVYYPQIKRLIDLEAIRSSGLSVMVDSMYGAGMGYFKELLAGSTIKVKEINGQRNPLFPGIQPEPVAKNLADLCTLVPQQKADVGLATDGDADRVGVVDEKGIFLTTHQVFALLALYYLDVHGEKGPIIKSLCSTNMIEKLGELYDVPVYETKVGFKYVAPLMKEHNAAIGGEESGGYGFRGHVPERDGILAGLFFLDFMLKTGKTPSQLIDYLYSKVGPHYYDRVDFHLAPDQKEPLMERLAKAPKDKVGDSRVKRLNDSDGYKFILEDDSWLLMRFSGTEPLLRIYAESNNTDRVQQLLKRGKEIVGL